MNIYINEYIYIYTWSFSTSTRLFMESSVDACLAPITCRLASRVSLQSNSQKVNPMYIYLYISIAPNSQGKNITSRQTECVLKIQGSG